MKYSIAEIYVQVSGSFRSAANIIIFFYINNSKLHFPTYKFEIFIFKLVFNYIFGQWVPFVYLTRAKLN